MPKLGTVDDLIEFRRRTRVDLVIFSLPVSAEGRILQMLKKLWVLPLDIRLAAHTSDLHFRPRSHSVRWRRASHPSVRSPTRRLGRGDEVVVRQDFRQRYSLCGITLMALVAMAIKIESRGPMTFRQ